MTSRVTRLILVAAVTAPVLAGCGGVGARLTFNDTEKVKVTEIVLTGGSGDVMVRTAAIDETRITRVIHRNSDPGRTYEVKGTVLTIDTDCGDNCSITYDIEAPENVIVRGELRSGDIGLTGVGTTDVTVTSGDIMVSRATGEVRAKATSGDINVVDSAGAATVLSTSGDVRALNIGGAVVARATSGDIDVQLTKANSVTAHATSGDVNVIVPAGKYQIRTDTGSGDARIVGVINDPAAKSVIDMSAASGDATLSAAPAA
jgi:DUF4097 and DUF4098 domain-containing protein YvlB